MAKHGDSRRIATSAHKARIRSLRVAKALSGVVIVFVAFVIGFAVRGDQALLERLGFSSLVVDIDRNPGATTSGDTYDSIGARVAEVEGILQTDSLDSYDLDTVTKNVLDAFADGTQDNYLRYYDASSYAKLLQDSSKSYAGIGVLFSEYNGRAYVVDVFDGSAAQLAGVQQGDFVEAIDGDRDHDWSQTEVVAALAREAGDSVVVTWRRPATLEAEGGEEFTKTLVCSEYRVKNVESELSGSVGFIKLKQLTQNSATLVKQAVADLAAQGATSYVLDIRDNPGGYLTQGVDVASLFIKSGTIVQIETRESKTVKSAAGSAVTDKPLIVLVNEHTAAAAEVLAAALKDSQRATLVGMETLGKGSVQVVRDLSFGGALRYTAAYYQSPQGHGIDGVGVTPDVTVASSGDGDNQLSLAIDTAQSSGQS